MQIREERLKDLPLKKKNLLTIGDSIEITDDELLGLDYDQFMQYYKKNCKIKLETDKINLEVEKENLKMLKGKLKERKKWKKQKKKTKN